jgi:hypothetical protein
VRVPFVLTIISARRRALSMRAMMVSSRPARSEGCDSSTTAMIGIMLEGACCRCSKGCAVRVVAKSKAGQSQRELGTCV